MKIQRQTLVIWGLILLGIAFLTVGVLFQKDPPIYYAQSLRNYQEADAVAGYPIARGGENQFWTAEFQTELNLLTGIERYRLPTARQFSDPTPQDEVKAIGNALVLMTGQVLVLGHRLPSGQIIQSLYRKVSNQKMTVGTLVARGAILGKGDAETICELYESDGIDLASPNRIDLAEFLSDHPVKDDYPEPLALIQNQEKQLGKMLEKIKLDSKSAEKLSEILGNQ